MRRGTILISQGIPRQSPIVGGDGLGLDCLLAQEKRKLMRGIQTTLRYPEFTQFFVV